MAATRKPRKLKVEGSGRRWYVWEWQVSCWNIISPPYLTKGRADKEKDKLK
jgi:hypothetical protein